MGTSETIGAALAAIRDGRARAQVLSAEPIRNVAWSYDRARFAVLGEGILQVWRTEPFGWERSYLLPAEEHGTGLAFSRDGVWIAVSGDGSIWRCDLETGGVSTFCLGGRPEEAGYDYADALGFAEDGRLVWVDRDGEIAAWDAEGQLAAAGDLSVEALTEDSDEAPGVARIVGQGYAEGRANLDRGYAEGPTRMGFLNESGEGGPDRWCAGFSPDSRWLVLGNEAYDGQNSHSEILLVDLRGQEPPRSFRAGHFTMRWDAAFNEGCTLIAIPHSNYLVEVRALPAGEIVEEVVSSVEDKHGGLDHLMPLRVTFCGEDVLVVTWSNPFIDPEAVHSTRAYSLPSGEELSIEEAAALPGVREVVFETAKHIEIRHAATLAVRARIRKPLGYIACSLSRQGVLAVLRRGGILQIHAPGRRVVRTLNRVQGPHGLDWSADGETLCVMGRWSTVWRWSAAWYRSDGVFLGLLPLPPSLPERASFTGDTLSIFLYGGKILRWTFEK